MILSISEKQLKEAKDLYDFGKLNGSLSGGRGNLCGAIGEVVVRDYFISKGCAVTHNGTYDYDLTVDGMTVDVKSKNTTVEPRPNYLCSISSFNVRQKCDYYFFTRVDVLRRKCYLLGWKSKSSFLSDAFFKREGEKDVGGWLFKDDCFNLPISSLDRKYYSEKIA